MLTIYVLSKRFYGAELFEAFPARQLVIDDLVDFHFAGGPAL